MAAHAAVPERLVDISERDGKLVLRRQTEPYKRRYTYLVGLALIVLVLLVLYVVASQVRPSMWFFVALIMILLLVIADRALAMRALAREENYVFDKVGDRIERNGELIRPLADLESVLVRQTMDGEQPLNEFALVIAFDDTKRATLVEAVSLPGARVAIEKAAELISEYTGKPVEHAGRRAEEWWLDQ